ncbi:N-acetylmuramic acid/N-acetylglucosamine kinase [Lederbergia ruris]|uniref:N-acetylmuramic acid/N-acetylglucosamine kinase n=2 Tax=Lederbergia ruris TaxID=217495 RepID=A0ABQ4KME9_9BACI|nr:N-acetylmuramic acid/N-acetylglucosamine kinase [Lederbergia ruris]
MMKSEVEENGKVNWLLNFYFTNVLEETKEKMNGEKQMIRACVIGLEGGGTNTRAMVADLQGHVLAYQESGSAHPYRDPTAKENIQMAILGALSTAERSLEDVCYVAAGLPCYQQKEDLPLAKSLLYIDGMSCPHRIMNDSEVGHIGAFLFDPGIMVVSGTGSIVMGYTEKGEVLFNSTFGHYAPTAARYLSYQAVHSILADQVQFEDKALIQEVLRFWQVEGIDELRELHLHHFYMDKVERDRQFGLMAPIVTRAAAHNRPLAKRVCDEAILTLETGIRLIGQYFKEERVKVSFVGSVVRSPYFLGQLTDILQKGSNKQYQVVEPILSPVAGAVLMALKEFGIPITEEILTEIAKHERSKIGP